MRTTDAGESRRYSIVSLFLMLLSNRFVYEFGRLLAKERPHFNLALPVDARFPVLPWTLVIYFGCFIWWTAVYLRIAGLDRKKADRFFCGNLLAKGICFMFFVLFPTKLSRPEVIGCTLWDALLRFLHRIDAPDNCFPSIHCMVSWLCWAGVRGRRDIPPVFRVFSLLMAVAVCLSTLTTRQHVLADIAGGVVLSEVCYACCASPALRRAYAHLADMGMRAIASLRQRKRSVG